MNERYEFSLRAYGTMLAHMFFIIYCWVSVIVLALLSGMYLVREFSGQDLEAGVVQRMAVMLGVMAAFVTISRAVETGLRSGMIKCKKRGLELEDEFFVYEANETSEQTVFWQEVTRIRLNATKMGFSLTVYSPHLKFTVFSHETDPLPISCREQWQQAMREILNQKVLRKQYREGLLDLEEYRRRKKEQLSRNILARNETFFKIIKNFKQKAVNAEFKKGWLVRDLCRDLDLLQNGSGQRTVYDQGL